MPTKAAVHGLVARAAARDQPDLPLDRGVGTDDDVRIELHPHEVRVRCRDTLQLLPYDVLRLVDELLHLPVFTSELEGADRFGALRLPHSRSAACAPSTPPMIGPITGTQL